MTEKSVIIATLFKPGAESLSLSYHKSIRQYMHHDLQHNQRLRGFIDEEAGSGRITDARNDAVRQFLRHDAEWLAFIDADMGFDSGALDHLLDAADAESRPVVGGLAFGQRRVGQGPQNSTVFEQYPTIYRWVASPMMAGWAPIHDYPKDSLVPCDATGAAFFVVHRSVLERLAEATSDHRRPWFFEMELPHKYAGEDLSFFAGVRALDIPVYVHTGVLTSHHKSTFLTEETQPSLADIPNVVVIPFKDKAAMTSNLVDSLDSQDEAAAILLMDNGSSDESRAFLARSSKGWGTPVKVINCEHANIHEMWNIGIRVAQRYGRTCNVAILNNDITIGDQFLSQLAKPLRNDPLVGVTCPNYGEFEGVGLTYVEDMAANPDKPGLPGFAFMMKGEAGYRFPEELKWWYGDNDLLTSLLYAGGKAALVFEAEVEHIGGGSQTGNWDDPEVVKILAEDQAKFRAKWPEVEVQFRG